MSTGQVIACDVGGTGIKAGLVDAAGRVSHAVTVPTPVVGGDGDATATAVLDRVAGLAADLSRAARAQPPPQTASGHTPPQTAMNGSLASAGEHQTSIHPHRQGSGDGGEGDGEPPVALGVVVPGLVDAAAGMARYSENLGWRDVPFAARLARATTPPVAFGHDVRAASAAEHRLGAARGHRDVAFVPIGTGIAAALVLDGRPVEAGGWAGEIGHIDVGSGLACVCGAAGCLETVASAAAIARRYTERSGRPVRGALDVAGRLDGRDPDAAAVWNEAADALAFALAAVAAVAAPELIVIGGGLSGAGDVLLDALRTRLQTRLSVAQRHPRLCVAALGDQAGLLGAALLAWQRAGVTMRRPD
ncbi:MAG TPA: ROK family protein [Streptosporangiaceae bacterium]|nr:ROK family protein [Streptosporangiaceae bacterium]